MYKMLKCIFIVLGTLYKGCNGHEHTFGSFWQWTDIHFDPWYYASQESCNKDISPVGKYGDFECDSPWALVKTSVDAMLDLPNGKDVDFILWSGDNVPHITDKTFYNENVNIDFIMNITSNLTNVINAAFPGKLVFPLLGNHDIYPANKFPANGGDFYTRYLDIWKKWINTTDAQTTFLKGGYYSLMISLVQKVRGVVLNSNLQLSSNSLTEGMEDPAHQFAWLEDIMTNARINGEKLYIFTHIPTGKVPEGYGGAAWSRSHHNSRYVQMFTSYSDVILGIFSAHAHHDIYKLYYNDEEKPVAAMFVPPSITPLRYIAVKEDDVGTARNPALRMVTFNKTTYEPLDIMQYSMNLVEANKKLMPEWKLVYTFSEAYGVENISISELHKTLQEFKKFDSRKFAEFYKYYTVATDHYGNKPICDCDCKTRFLCSVEYQIYEEWDQCYNEMQPCHDEPMITDTGSTLQSLLTIIYALMIVLFKVM